MIKYVSQAMPLFAMSVFKIPKTIFKAMKNAISKYWWGSNENQKHMHWVA